MRPLTHLLADLKKGIASNMGDFAFDASSVQNLSDQINETHKEELQLIIELEYNTYHFVSSRIEDLYLFVLLWKAIQFSPDFVIQLAKNALKDKKITRKQAWIGILEDQRQLEPIVDFFKENPDYGDKYFQEQMLYHLSETSIDIGNELIPFLKSEETILAVAATAVVFSQGRKEHYPLIVSIFQASVDTDILLEFAPIIAEWDDNYREILRQKIQFLAERNRMYYADCIDELKAIINQN